MNFDWDNLRLFLAIARAGTLAGASSPLPITWPMRFSRPYFQGFVERYPSIELELLIVSALLDLSRREADIAFA